MTSVVQPQTIHSHHPESPRHPHATHHVKIKRRSSAPLIAWVQKKLASASTQSTRKEPPSSFPSNSLPTPKGRSISASESGSSRKKHVAAADGSIRVTEHGKRRNSNQKASTAATLPSTSRGSVPLKKSKSTPKPNSIDGLNTLPKSRSTRPATAGTSSARPGVRGVGDTAGMTRQELSLDTARLPSFSMKPHAISTYSTSPSSSPRSPSLSLSLGPGSTWSPSNPPEADDDASIRPLPPTSPPSPVPSRLTQHSASSDVTQTSGYLSEGKTFRSGAASTKPTTLMSIDLGAGFMGGTYAHIAQAPPSTAGGRSSIGGGNFSAPNSPSVNRFPNASRLSGHSQAFSTSASVQFTGITNGSLRHPLSTAQVPEGDVDQDGASDHSPDGAAPKFPSYQIPNLSHYHPRNNPRPASPPLDNASVLTLASSTFAGNRHGPASIISRFPGTLSIYGGPTTSLLDGGDVAAPDASVRALRPRSRRGSWGSFGSAETSQTGWSAVLKLAGTSISGNHTSQAGGRNHLGAPSITSGKWEVDEDTSLEGEETVDNHDMRNDSTDVPPSPINTRASAQEQDTQIAKVDHAEPPVEITVSVAHNEDDNNGLRGPGMTTNLAKDYD